MKIQLIVQYFRCATKERQEEIDICLRNNLLNNYISTVHLLTEEELDVSVFHNKDKIKQTVIGDRLTYRKAFEYANQCQDSSIWILANADIYFDESLKCLENNELINTIYALSRHEIASDGSAKFMDEEYAHGSQDAWIFKPPVNIDSFFSDFRLGIPGCDNRLAYELIKADYNVVNPSKIVKCYHLDKTRETDIEKRTAEYIKLHSSESIESGNIAAPPYQFYIYPTEVMGLEHLDVYKPFIKRLAELTERNAEIQNCNVQFALYNKQLSDLQKEYNRIIEEQTDCIARQAEQLLEYKNSLSWRVTEPLRKIAAMLTKMRKPHSS
jgi:hypothetical protein